MLLTPQQDPRNGQTSKVGNDLLVQGGGGGGGTTKRSQAWIKSKVEWGLGSSFRFVSRFMIYDIAVCKFERKNVECFASQLFMYNYLALRSHVETK